MAKKGVIYLIMTLLAIAAQVTAAAQPVVKPCPEVLINEKYDHVRQRQYQNMGWDTAITCRDPQIILTSEPFIPVEKFNGTYEVTEIPYDPPDPTFSRGTRMPLATDDDFADNPTDIPFAFCFFGLVKSQFVLGANGMVSFNPASAGQRCPPWYDPPHAALPWPNGKAGTPGTSTAEKALMRDAIYGIYEDTHPLASYLYGTQGIYYGVQDEWPCRKIICSWNGIPIYPGSANLSNRCTYQIVCYEGSNIIEVHVKRRGVSTGPNGAGVIGIQNATGQPQQPNTEDYFATNYYVVPNSPAYFSPDTLNSFTTGLEYKAYRFAPQGRTSKNEKWYRIFDDGRDSVDLPSYSPGIANISSWATDSNAAGYYYPMDKNDTLHPTLTRAIVEPKCVSRYVIEVNFFDATGNYYPLRDTITIGIDTISRMRLAPLGAPDSSHVHDICKGQTSAVSIKYPESQNPERIEWTIERILNGQHIPLDSTLYTIDAAQRNLILRPDPAVDSLMPRNKVDTIFLLTVVDFMGGCSNTDSAWVLFHPIFDTIDHEGACMGESYTWPYNGQTYTESTTGPYVTLHTQQNCDSTVHLHLTIFDNSLYIDRVVTCKPITWLNGKTYYEDNTATAEQDTVQLINSYGCDSVVQLNFTINPLTPIIRSSIDHFDYDHFDVVLTDASIGDSARLWKLPDHADMSVPTVYYSITPDRDSAVIEMIAYSPYGCVDTARLVMPFNRETMWLPNIFTPDNLDGNNRFGSASQETLRQEMYIYSRTGELVFHCEGVDCEWDGRRTDGQPCPSGGYAYVIRYTTQFEPNVTKIKKGSVTLIR